jgi:uridine kinase
MENNPIIITIQGCSGTGKSAIAQLIRDQILFYGIKASIEDDSFFQPNQFTALSTIARENRQIIIKTEQAIRHSL